MQMRRLLRRDKELLDCLSGDEFVEAPAGTEIASINNLVAHKLAVTAKTVNKRGRIVTALKLTEAGVTEKRAQESRRMKYRAKSGFIDRNQPVEAE